MGQTHPRCNTSEVSDVTEARLALCLQAEEDLGADLKGPSFPSGTRK